jgi:ATP dependent DNA ligase domain
LAFASSNVRASPCVLYPGGRGVYGRQDADVFLYAFDLIELNGDDMRRGPLEVCKATLASVLAKAAPGLRLCEHLDHADGAIVFAHACKMGLEGIVSTRRDSPYRSGRSPDWLKSKNPACEAVRPRGGGGLGPMRKPTGAQFKVSIDGTPRTYRDLKALTVEAAEHLKRKHPHSTVTVKDPQTGEATAVEYKPVARGR